MSNFTLTEEILLKLLSASINGTKAQIDEETLKQADWNAIGLFSFKQAVSLAVFDVVTPYKKYIPANIYDKWYAHVLKAFSKNSALDSAQKQLHEEICNDCDYAILKGIAAAQYYNRPELRNLGDIDFLIAEDKLEVVSQKITAKGYERHSDNDCHVCFVKNGVALEMHFEIPGIPYGEKGNTVRDFVKGILPTAKNVVAAGNTFTSPSDMYNGVVFLLHMQHHMVSEGLGLRHLSDWACYINKTHNDAFWNELLPFFKSIGIYKYCQVMTKTCSIYLGSACPDWAAKADKDLCYQIIRDILSSGNFGKLDSTRKTSGMMVSEHGKDGMKHGKVYNLARALHSSMYNVYPIVKRVPVLYPFLYVWRIFVYIFKVIKGERVSLIKAASVADQRKSLYEQLEIFETK